MNLTTLTSDAKTWATKHVVLAVIAAFSTGFIVKALF